MSKPTGEHDAEKRQPHPSIKGRSIALTAWVAVGLGLIIAGIVNGVLDQLTIGYAIAGLIAGAWFGAFVAFMMLLPGEPFNWINDGKRPEMQMGIGSRPMTLLTVAIVVVFNILREGWPIPGGPIDAVMFVTVWLIGLSALYYDLWIATPRRISGEDYDPTKLGDGGQTGLSDRTGAVVFWLVPLWVITFLMLIGWSFVGVDEVNILDGFLTGIAIGSVVFGAVMLATLGSYAERVRRHQRFGSRDVLFETGLKVFGWIVGLAAVVAIVEQMGFCAGMFASVIVTSFGLAATIVDRWMITPRKMSRERQSSYTATVSA